MSEERRDLREIVRDEMLVRDRVLAALESGPKTVPEIAAELGAPSYEVMHWVMAARKYGYLGESLPTEDGYYRYTLKAKE
ncbi:MAG: MarR family transcriptional regulator [Acidimicrobiia bacterium]|nr:MarR family transcriptional regulator [Acidimicrobiia bacterium]